MENKDQEKKTDQASEKSKKETIEGTRKRGTRKTKCPLSRAQRSAQSLSF